MNNQYLERIIDIAQKGKTLYEKANGDKNILAYASELALEGKPYAFVLQEVERAVQFDVLSFAVKYPISTAQAHEIARVSKWNADLATFAAEMLAMGADYQSVIWAIALVASEKEFLA